MRGTLTLCCALLSAMIFGSAAYGEEGEVSGQVKEIDMKRVSRAVGHCVSKNLASMGCGIDRSEVVQGLQEALAGKDSPMDDAECMRIVGVMQEEASKKLASKNLQEADAFLLENGKKEGVVESEPGRLQYKIEKEGVGAVVEKDHSPMLRYTGRLLDGKVFTTSVEEESLSLEETIPGFGRGVVGMKEGEKRTLYIHPEIGFGAEAYLSPNALLIFEVEVLKAHVAVQKEETAGEGVSESVASAQP